MLSVEGLTVAYAGAPVVTALSFSVARGEILAIVGRNGAGKSTTLKAVIGLLPAAAGRIAFNGVEIGGLPVHERCRRGLGYVPEERRIFQGLTAAENLQVGRRSPRVDLAAWTPEAAFGLFPDLAGLAGRLGGALSGGEQQMLTIARTLMGNPALILLDEPTTGLAPRVITQLTDAIRALRAQGLGVVLAEQNLHFAEALADAVLVLESGHERWRGSAAAFAGDTRIRHDYLGV